MIEQTQGLTIGENYRSGMRGGGTYIGTFETVKGLMQAVFVRFNRIDPSILHTLFIDNETLFVRNEFVDGDCMKIPLTENDLLGRGDYNVQTGTELKNKLLGILRAGYEDWRNELGDAV